MQKEPVDTLLERLYSSNDPMCFEAAVLLEQYIREVNEVESRLSDISLAAKYMMESLLEINALSRDRDKSKIKNAEARNAARLVELNLRLSECGNIATDTINLSSVKRAYERMYCE